MASLIICTLLYISVSGVLTGMKKYTAFADDAAAIATAVEVSGKTWVQAVISAGALAGLTSVLLVFQLGQPRIFMAMARDGLLPEYFARIHRRFRTPHITTIWTGVFVGLIAMIDAQNPVTAINRLKTGEVPSRHCHQAKPKISSVQKSR